MMGIIKNYVAEVVKQNIGDDVEDGDQCEKGNDVVHGEVEALVGGENEVDDDFNDDYTMRDDEDLYEAFVKEEVANINGSVHDKSNVNNENVNYEGFVDQCEVVDEEEDANLMGDEDKRVAKENPKDNTMEVERENIVYGGKKFTFSYGSSNNGLGPKRTKHKEFKSKTNMVDPTFIVGMILSIVY